MRRVRLSCYNSPFQFPQTQNKNARPQPPSRSGDFVRLHRQHLPVARGRRRPARHRHRRRTPQPRRGLRRNRRLARRRAARPPNRPRRPKPRIRHRLARRPTRPSRRLPPLHRPLRHGPRTPPSPRKRRSRPPGPARRPPPRPRFALSRRRCRRPLFRRRARIFRHDGPGGIRLPRNFKFAPARRIVNSAGFCDRIHIVRRDRRGSLVLLAPDFFVSPQPQFHPQPQNFTP